jgi:hypothetical protein
MSSNPVSVRGDHLVFRTTDESTINRVETRLKRKYSRGVFIQDTFESPDGEVLLELGSSYPKDVSDKRENDRVLKFINVGEIDTLRAEETGEGYYQAELPDRDELYEEFENRREEILNRLDWSMAKAIYEDVYRLKPVRNQLSGIIDIVNYLSRESPISIERLDRIQGQANTRDYLRVLDNFDFVEIEGEEVRQGTKMEAADMNVDSYEEYEKTIVGQIIKDAYYVLYEQLELRMLSHFPKYANSYYLNAIQKQDPDLHLDKRTMKRNLAIEWDENVDSLVLDRKIDQLTQVGVLERDGDYIVGNENVFGEVYADAEDMALAD